MKLRDYLIASETNDYKPWVITPAALAVFCLTIWSLRIFVPTAITLAETSIDATDLMTRINQERTNRFIPTLATNTKLISAANGKANDMIERSYFSHVDPDGNYVWPRIEAAGYKPYLRLGENLAMDFTAAADVVREWMNSPTHRENIINAKYNDQGLASVSGLYDQNHNTVVIVSLFGSLYSTTTPTPPTQTTPPPAPKPVVKNPPSSSSSLKISPDIKVTNTSLSGKIFIDIDSIIAGSPALVTAKLKTQSITLVSGSVAGQFIGKFTFDASEDLTNQTLHIEARDKNGIKASLDYPIDIERTEEPVVGNSETRIPVSGEAQIMSILRIIFGIFATIYMAFLAIDAIIIHRSKIKRDGLHSHPHLLLFALIVAISIFTSFS